MDVRRLLAREATPRVMQATLSDIARSHTLRCDARQWERRFADLDSFLDSVPHFYLGQFLPSKIVKGKQPVYADTPDAVGTAVISTMAVRNLAVDVEACRLAVEVDYGPDDVRKPQKGDVLLTVDGGTSIGKPVLFDLDDDFAIDSHVAILRPAGLAPELLVYLLASPIGQAQFQRAESGASGQTTVGDDDIRRFRFPAMDDSLTASAISAVATARARATKLRAEAAQAEIDGWDAFLGLLTPQA